MKKSYFWGMLALLVTVAVLSQTYFSGTEQTESSTAAAESKSIKTQNARFLETDQLVNTDIQSAYSSFLERFPESKATSIQKITLEYELESKPNTSLPASAVVFIPEGNFDQPLPILIYGPGTTGLADRCAPSNENPLKPTLGNYENQMIAQAAQGTVVIMPNYLGFDTNEQLQYYFLAKKEAVSMLSSVQALSQALATHNQELPEINLQQVFLGGYSQGGHSAFAAADYQPEIAPDIKILGIIGHGPTPNVSNVLKLNPNLAPYITSAYENYYDDFDPSTILNQEYLSSLDEAERICADEGFGYNTVTAEQIYQEDFLEALNSNTVSEVFPNEGKKFEANYAGTLFNDIPVFLAQGTTDPIVSMSDQDVFVADMCTRGVSVQYQLYPDEHHFFIRQVSFEDTQSWLAQVMSGARPSNCS